MRRQMSEYQEGVGKRLLTLRKQKGWNQEDAAHHVGVSLKTWRNWERGLRAPYERNWTNIQNAFELASLDELRGSPPSPLALGDDETRGDQLDRIEEKLDDALALGRQIIGLIAQATTEELPPDAQRLLERLAQQEQRAPDSAAA